MSSRVLRKLQGRNELQALAALAESSDDDASSPTQTENLPRNPFTLLNDSNSDPDGKDEDNIEPLSEEIVNDPQALKKTKKKSKNQRKKKPNTKETNSTTDDIEKVIKEVEKLDLDSSLNQSRKKGPVSKKSKYVLAVEHRFLNPDNELRRIFGSRALMGDANYRHRSLAKASRGTWLTAPTPSWPKMTKTGLSMERTESSHKYEYFAFEHNKDYQKIQFQFLDAVDSADHNQIALVLRENNYHVDSLLTLSDVCRVNDDSQMARELLERALYCMERNFHSQFNLATGTCRLPYKRVENRALFLALYRHLHFVFQRGCSRTALELCKVLLNLDPDEDPICVLLFIDFFALQSAEYKFLIQLFNEWETHKNLSQLPNFAFSVAMAHYELAASRDRDFSFADHMLQDALLKFPSILMLLLDKCGVEPDKKVSSHSFFTTEANQTCPDGLQLLCNMFVSRNHTLWKSPEIMSWLESNVHKVVERVEKKDPLLNKYRLKRKRYQKPPLNIYRYAMISELPGVISLLPPDIRLGQVLSHDPLPPPDTIVSYTRPERTRRARSDNPLGLFLQSLMPQFDPNEEAPLEGAVGGAQLNNADMRQRVQSVMEAMRNMLGNFNLPENEEQPEFQEDEWD